MSKQARPKAQRSRRFQPETKFSPEVIERARAELFDQGVDEGSPLPDFQDRDGGWGTPLNTGMDESERETLTAKVHFLDCKSELLAQRLKYLEEVVVQMAQQMAQQTPSRRAASFGA